MTDDPVWDALVSLVRAIENDAAPIIYGPAYAQAIKVIRERVAPSGREPQVGE